MKISKTVTPNFEDFDVYCTRSVWRWPFEREVKLEGIVEADDVTGKVILQVLYAGCPVYTNGAEEIYIDNTAKILLMIQGVRESFHRAGFQPKLVVEYLKNVRIVNKNPAVSLEKVERRLDELAESNVQ